MSGKPSYPSACLKHKEEKKLDKRGRWQRRQCVNEFAKAYKQRNPGVARRAELKLKYKITVEEFELMLASQGGRCAICRTDRPEHGKRKNFYVDHDHSSGCVRGLLCACCNFAIGHLRDSSAVADSAASYLRKHGR